VNATAQKAPQTTAIAEIRKTLDTMAPQFQAALPPQVTPEKFLRVVMTAVGQNKDLLNANRSTLYAACMKAAQDGLLPDGREGALVMYGQNVQWMPMVTGILKKIRNSGELAMIGAHLVHKNDPFKFWVDSDGEHLEHRPDIFGDRGQEIGAYAIAKTKDGAFFVEPMTKAEIEEVRKVSRAKNGPWQTWWGEMAKKTVIRRLSKRLPMSSDVEQTLKRDDEAFENAQEVAAEQGQTTEGGAKRSRKQSRLSQVIGSSDPVREEPPVNDLGGAEGEPDDQEPMQFE
jgi:recombination protein RecT